MTTTTRQIWRSRLFGALALATTAACNGAVATEDAGSSVDGGFVADAGSAAEGGSHDTGTCAPIMNGGDGGHDWIGCFAACSPCTGCDIKANPPVCFGGILRINCHGNCTATAGNPNPGPPSYCSGICDGDFEVLCCEGGKMVVGCGEDAKCAAACAPKGVCP